MTVTGSSVFTTVLVTVTVSSGLLVEVVPVSLPNPDPDPAVLVGSSSPGSRGTTEYLGVSRMATRGRGRAATVV